MPKTIANKTLFISSWSDAVNKTAIQIKVKSNIITDPLLLMTDTQRIQTCLKVGEGVLCLRLIISGAVLERF